MDRLGITVVFKMFGDSKIGPKLRPIFSQKYALSFHVKLFLFKCSKYLGITVDFYARVWGRATLNTEPFLNPFMLYHVLCLVYKEDRNTKPKRSSASNIAACFNDIFLLNSPHLRQNTICSINC